VSSVGLRVAVRYVAGIYNGRATSE